MSVCIVAIFKNESHILKEWMEHYISQGIDKFFLIDHNSTDNYFHILQPYINSGMVELFLETQDVSELTVFKAKEIVNQFIQENELVVKEFV